MPVNPGNPQILGAYNAMVPKEGPKVIPITAKLSVNASVLVDLSQLQQLGKISFVQGVMVDNSENSSPITISTQTINQNIVIPAYSQGILPIFVSNPPIFTISSTGGIDIPVFFFNVPLPAQVWGGNSGFTFSNGALIVSDPTLEGLISNLGTGNGLNVNVISTVGGSGGGGAGSNSGIVLFASADNSMGGQGGNSANSGSGKYLYITGHDLILSGNATAATAGINEIGYEFASNSEYIWGAGVYVGTTATGYNQRISSVQFSSPIKSPNPADQIHFFTDPSGIALATGKLYINLYGFIQ